MITSVILRLLSILRNVPTKVWLYVALALAYPACYFVGHHKGYVAGKTHCEEQYKEQQEAQSAKNKKDNEQDKKQAMQDNSKLVDEITQLKTSRDGLTKKLNELSKAKQPASSNCPSLSADDQRLLREAVDKANN